MGRHRNYQKTDLSSIPSEFDLDKYDFKDDSELWFAALTLRFELKREVEEFLAWKVADDEFSEQRLELRDDVISRLQKKILLLMDKPVSLNSDNSARPPELRHATAWAETSKDQVSQFWGKSQAVSDRLVVDEFRSAMKLQDEAYKKLFDNEIENFSQKREKLFSSGLFGIPLRQACGEKHSVGEALRSPDAAIASRNSAMFDERPLNRVTRWLAEHAMLAAERIEITQIGIGAFTLKWSAMTAFCRRRGIRTRGKLFGSNRTGIAMINLPSAKSAE